MILPKWKSFLLFIFVFTCTSGGANIIVLNGLSHQYNLQSKSVEKGYIRLKNMGAKEQLISVYQTDFLFNHLGETFYEQPGKLERSNAQWLTISPLSLTLLPGEIKEIHYNIHIPDSALLYGTYWSAIIIEPTELTNTDQTAKGLKVKSIFRYAVQIITDVNDPGESGLEFLNINLSHEDSASVLVIDALNTGDNMMASTMAVEIFDEKGTSKGVFNSLQARTYPGTSKRYFIKLPQLNAGTYNAMLIADSEKNEVFGIQLNLDIEDD